MLDDIISGLPDAGAEEIEAILQAVLRRYCELFPKWEISVLSLDKREGRTAQLDRIIAALNKLKQMEAESIQEEGG